ncbi:MAG: S9 family peptidase, partial [Bacteroidia bacterium]|nr:S9 family peptidase [Bacteroidia bacterium]
AMDTVGRFKYSIRFKNLQTGQWFPEIITETSGNIAWSTDNQTVFYIKKHPETLREYQLYKHKLGTDPKQDTLVYEETDETFSIQIQLTRTKRFLVLVCNSTNSTETKIIPADKPNSTFVPFIPRASKHEYSIEDDGNRFLVISNYQAKNFRLLESPIQFPTSIEQLKEIIPHRNQVLLESVIAFHDYWVVVERENGLIQMRIFDKKNQQFRNIDFGESVYSVSPGYVPEYRTKDFQYYYTSLTTPKSVYQYDLQTQQKTLLKQQAVLGGFKSDDYQSERILAKANDGTMIPISIVYKKGFVKNGKAPLYLTAYGSYGSSFDVYFSPARISLLERGFAFAIAHVRGGQELGRDWYEQGRLLHKKNTFTDFIACSEELIRQQFTSPQLLVISGGSAGGLLMGVVINSRPDLYKVCVADVPFVDVVTTMQDSTIPLTTSEYDEWGNPDDPVFYEYMLSYSPYDNVRVQKYPNLLVTTGFHDSQVQYWEPAKWVARLRKLKTDNNLLLLKTNFEAGHGGASGRFEAIKEIAFEYAFIFKCLGIQD